MLVYFLQVPISANDISGGNGHKVAVGISDGFYIDEPVAKGNIMKVVGLRIGSYHTLWLNSQRWNHFDLGLNVYKTDQFMYQKRCVQI